MDIQVYCAHSRMVDIEAMVENPRNPNKHSDKQISLLAKIIKSQGWRNPIVVSNRSGFIVKGHCRLAAHDSLGQLDFSAFEEEDEEILAFAATSFFYRLADEIARLEEAEFFGNAQLKAHFSGADEAPEDEETAPEDLSAPEAPASEAETESVVL